MSAQQRAHLLAISEGRPRPEHIALAVPIRPGIAPAAVRDRLRLVTAAHPVLRATIAGADPATARLLVGDDGEPPFDLVDAADAAAAVAAHRATAFGAAGRPLWGARLVRAGGAALVSLAFDNLVADGITAGVLLRDFVAAGPVTAPAVTYRDFVHEQDARYGDAAAGAFAFWRAELAGVPVNRAVPLPFCRDPRGPLSGDVRTVSFDGGPALAAATAAAAARARATPFVLLLATLYGVLAEVTGERDLSVRVRVHGRPHGHERTVGLFADDVVLRVRDARDPAAVRAAWLRTLPHQLVPYARVVERVEPDLLVRDHRPAEVSVSAPSLPSVTRDVPGRRTPGGTGATDVPGLHLMLAGQGKTLHVAVTYDVARFAHDDVVALLARYESALREAVG